MGNLWQFFGLPDPDAGGAARVAEAPATTQNRQLTNELVAEPRSPHADQSSSCGWRSRTNFLPRWTAPSPAELAL